MIRAVISVRRQLALVSCQPSEGFTAFFVDAEWDSGLATAPCKFMMEVTIIPNTLPCKWADAAAKYASAKPNDAAVKPA